MEKKLYLLAELDNESQIKIKELDKIIAEGGLTGKQTRDIPYHITLCSFECSNENHVLNLLENINGKFRSMDILFSSLGLFGLNVLFLNPAMNRKLIELYDSLNSKSCDCGGNLTAHVTLLIDEPENILKILPKLSEQFRPFTGKIVGVSLYEFFPKKFIKKIDLLPQTDKKSSIRENLKNYYNSEAELRNSKSVRPEWKNNVREKFLKIIKQENKKTLLELGAGPGYDSQFFMNNGLSVVAVDLSSEMVNKCKEKNVEAYELDFYNLSSLDKKFDCIYAINSLLHVPKDDLPVVLGEINLVLNTGGLFYMGVYGGNDSENEYVKKEVSEIPRFFAYHSKSYLISLLEKYFEIIIFDEININDKTECDIFYSIVMVKKIN